MFDRYSESDKRKWTIVINPSTDSILLTCIDNGDWPHRGLYKLDDDNNIGSIEVDKPSTYNYNYNATQGNTAVDMTFFGVGSICKIS